MLNFIGFGDTLARLLARIYGERAMATVSIYQSPDGELRAELPDSHITKEECCAALDALVFSLRAGDNVGVVEIDGNLHQLPFLHWYTPPYWADPPPDTRLDRAEYGRPILIDEDRFEVWLSNVLEDLDAKEQDAAQGETDLLEDGQEHRAHGPVVRQEPEEGPVKRRELEDEEVICWIVNRLKGEGHRGLNRMWEECQRDRGGHISRGHFEKLRDDQMKSLAVEQPKPGRPRR